MQVADLYFTFSDIEVYGDVYYWSQESGHVYLMSEDGSPQLIDHISEAAALAYDPLAHTLYCSSPRNNRVGFGNLSTYWI